MYGEDSSSSHNNNNNVVPYDYRDKKDNFGKIPKFNGDPE